MGLKSVKYTPNPKHTDVLKEENHQPVDQVSTNQFECRVKGRIAHIRGKEDPHNILSGGVRFVCHASRYIRVFNQASIRTVDTICSKESYDYQEAEVGVTVK